MQNVLVYTTGATPPAGAAPFYGRDLQNDIYQAQLLDEAAVFGAGSTLNVTNSDLQTTQLSAPAGLTVTAQGTTGSTSYTYLVADVSNAGTLAPATGVANSAGNATLTPTNSMLISWTGILGHTYNIYRSVSGGTPSSTGLIGTVTLTAAANVGGQTIYNNTPLPTVLATADSPNVTQNAQQPVGVQTTVTATFTDTGIAATGNVPTVNTTGAIAAAGPIFGNGPVLSAFNPQTVTNSAAVTWTVANMTNGILIRAGSTGSAVSDVTPTAAALVAAMPGVKVNQAFKLLFKNTTGFNVSVTGGTGVTVSGTAAVASVNIREYSVVYLNVTPGTESVTVYGGPVSAY